jgi:hypothetical protein
MVSKISEEEMQRASKFKTEEELIKLGTSIAEKKFEGRLLDNMIKDKEIEINRLRAELSNFTKKQVLDIFNMYINLQKKKFERRDTEFNKLKEAYYDLLEENKANIIEIDDLEEKKDTRIIKLRNKCIEKNKKNRHMRIFCCISNILSFCIGYLGIFIFLNNIFTAISHIIFYIISLLYYTAVTISYIYDAIIVNRYYTLYITIGIVVLCNLFFIKLKIS